MSVTIETAVTELKSKSLADPSQHLKPKGRDEVASEISLWEGKGLRAHVIVIDPGDSLSDMLGAWKQLGLDEKKDLLLVFDTHGFAARGWGLSDADLREALLNAKPHEHEVFAARLIAAIDVLGARATGERATPVHEGHLVLPESGSSNALPIVGGVVGIAGVGVIALAIMRRNKLAKEGLANLADARKSADRAYTDLILACEELPGDPQASEIQLKASDLKKRVDTLVAETEAKPQKGTDPVQIGKIRQLENELAALRSTVLQKEKR
jgi:hypothetical protein